MLNIIWPFFLIISFIYAIYSGKVYEVNNSIFNSTKSAVELTLTLIGNMCLWNGIIKIATRTTIIDKLNKITKIRKLKYNTNHLFNHNITNREEEKIEKVYHYSKTADYKSLFDSISSFNSFISKNNFLSEESHSYLKKKN